MPGANNGKKGAVVGGVALGALFCAWALMHHAPRDPNATAARPSSAPKKSHSSWLPWLGGDEDAKPAPKTPDLYKGPRIAVTVKVVDVEGKPVSGASVEARVDGDEWESAGLDEKQYEELLNLKHPDEVGAAADESGSAPADVAEEDGWHSAPRVAVESGRTDRSGLYVAKMKPDVSVVFFATDGSREGVSAAVYVYSPDDEDAPGASKHSAPPGMSVTIEIADLGMLAGRVTDDHGRPIAGADLRLAPWMASEVEQEDLVVTKEGAPPAMKTGEDGTFKIPLRTAGAFDLEVHAKGFQPVIKQAVQVLPGRQTDVAITMSASAGILGVVVDDAGTPVDGARVVIQGDIHSPQFASTEVLTQEDGTFAAEELAPGRFTLAASAEGFRPVEMWDVESGGPSLTLRLVKGGRIHGEVTLSDEFLRSIPRSDPPLPPEVVADDPESGALTQGDVYLSTVTDEMLPIATGVPRGKLSESPSGGIDARGRYFASVPIDANGRGTFDVEGLPSGSFVLTVTVGAAVTTIASVRVYEGNTSQVRVVLPDRGAARLHGTLTIDDGRPTGEASAFLYGALPTGLSAVVTPDGHFTFPSVPAGDYMIHAVAVLGPPDGKGAQVNAYAQAHAVHVPEGGDITIDLVAKLSSDGGSIAPPLDDAEGLADEPVGIVRFDSTDSHEDSRGEGWSPDVGIEQIDTGLVVTSAPPASGKRLYGGDRVTQIDGTPIAGMESWEALELLYGPRDSICAILADRPATHESISVALPRTRPPASEEDFGAE